MDQPLRRMLDDEEMKTVEKAFSDASYPVNLLLGVRPWVAGLFLSSSSCQVDSLAAGLKPLDLLVSDAAKAGSIQLVGLEDLVEQYEALASIPDEVQRAWLRASIEMHDRVDDVTHTIVELYRFRRLPAVWELTREMAPRAKLTDDILREIQDGLIRRRNPRMLERSLPLIQAGSAFIAVGAMHLSGSDGLVAMLETKGFTLVAVE